MADAVDLVVPSDQDEAIFAGWEAGKGLRTLARTFGVTVAEVERALDRMLPVFDAQSQLRAFKRELHRLEDLSSEFYTLAKRDQDRDSAHLVARLNERICAMRGFSPMNVRLDPLVVQVQEKPSSSTDRIRAALEHLAQQQLPAPSGNGQDEPEPDQVQRSESLEPQ
jgi:hypothetical protein